MKALVSLHYSLCCLFIELYTTYDLLYDNDQRKEQTAVQNPGMAGKKYFLCKTC